MQDLLESLEQGPQTPQIPKSTAGPGSQVRAEKVTSYAFVQTSSTVRRDLSTGRQSNKTHRLGPRRPYHCRTSTMHLNFTCFYLPVFIFMASSSRLGLLLAVPLFWVKMDIAGLQTPHHPISHTAASPSPSSMYPSPLSLEQTDPSSVPPSPACRKPAKSIRR